jgi:hypothetical protein
VTGGRFGAAVSRRVLAVTAGVLVAGTALAVPAYAVDYDEHSDDYWQVDSTCGTNICVSTVHRDHKVKSITVRTLSGKKGTLRAYWGDFEDTRKRSAKATWDIDDKDGRTRGPHKALRDSDLVCGSVTLPADPPATPTIPPTVPAPIVEKDVCVAI